jgi:hypothetical protein
VKAANDETGSLTLHPVTPIRNETSTIHRMAFMMPSASKQNVSERLSMGLEEADLIPRAGFCTAGIPEEGSSNFDRRNYA